MPFQLTAGEVVSYNSNIFAIPTSMDLLPGQQRGDFTSTSTFDPFTKTYWHGQQSNLSSFNTGVNWSVTSRCARSVAGTLTRAPSLITEQARTAINYSTSAAVNETGKCAVSNGYSLVFNSGWTRTNNSAGLNSVNNNETVMIAAGIEYAKAQSDVTALATISKSNYGNRTELTPVVALANTVALHSFALNYARQIDPDFSVVGQVGLVGVTSGFDLRDDPIDQRR
jgi:hypothetical protein